MSLKKINQLFNFEKGVLQSSKCIEGEYNFITAAADWKTHNEYSHDCEALIFAAAASGSLGRTHYVNGKFISSDLCFILTPKEPEKLPVDLKFYHIIFNLYKNEIVAATKAGTSKEAIGLKVFGEYELPYFDISIQYKVKAEFGKAEALKNGLIDEYNYQLTQIENLNQAISQEAVQGKLVLQDKNDEPASELLKRIKAEKAKSGKKEKLLPPIKPDEIPFDIPENWVWCRLGDVIDSIVGGGTPSKMNASYWNGNIPWASVKDLKGKFLHDTIDKITEIAIESSSTNLIPANNIIVCTRMGLGKICINKIDTAINQDLKAVFLNKNIEPEYFYNYYRTLKIIGSGMTVNGIKQEQLLNFHFPLPPLSEQKRIVAEIEKQLAKTKLVKEHIIANQQATEQLLKALLHQAFEVN